MAKRQIIAMDAPVSIAAAEGESDKGPRTFSSTFYTGGAMNINGWDLPVVVDLAGLKAGNVLVANLDHDSTKRVGNFEVVNDGKQLVANGKATAATAARDEVVNSAANGYQWQASLEVNPGKVETLAKGKTAVVNGQEITGPAYITRTGTLKGFGFVSHGADDNTTATIAATAASSGKGSKMDQKIKAWAEAMGVNVDAADADQLAVIEANYKGQNKKPAKIEASDNPFEARKIEAKRKQDIRECADRVIELRNSDLDEIEAIEKMVEHAIEAKMDTRDFRLELTDAIAIPRGQTVMAKTRDRGLTNEVIEAAICQAGKMPGYEDLFNDQVLQAAHTRFKGRIGLNQIFMLAAEANGYRGDYASKVTVEVQNAAFGMSGRNIAASGMSTIVITNVLSNVANKFLMVGWNAIDMTPLRIAKIRSVNDFKQITTVSLTGDLQFEKVGAAGEIKHGTLGDMDVLRASTINENSLTLPNITLDRKLYERVNKVIVAAGGKWSKSHSAHIFSSDPRASLGMALESGEVLNKKQAFQEFFTPEELAEQMCRVLDSTDRVLEPSAGIGRIAIAAADRGAKVFCCELQENNYQKLKQDERLIAWHGDFLNLSPDLFQPFDCVLMNPPFSDGQCHAHVKHAVGFLRDGGQLVSVMPRGLALKSTKACDAWKKWLDCLEHEIEELPSDTFKESGTRVETCLLTIRR